jgi:subtilisin family serine protease
MKLRNVFFLFVLMLLAFAGCVKNDSSLQDQDNSLSLKSASINGKYIVVLNEDAVIAKSALQSRNEKVKAKAYGLLKKYEISGEIEEVYQTALQGFTVKMAPGQAKKMVLDENVKIVEADQIVTLSPIVVNGKPGGGGTNSQSIPWGITRVGGGGATYAGTHVAWIIDTGIDLTHPDLNVDQTLGRNFVPRVYSPNDDNGHGSHVAGIIAARNNGFGVIGVAPGAKVVPVKVLDRQGSGAYSNVISGIDYVANVASAGDVANMSLGGPVSSSLDIAVTNAAAKGIKFALAAGNESTNANNSSPARVNGPNIFTVSAMGTNDKWASFSNFGNPPIDFCAPGVNIYSTYKGGGYATMSGTSMAAPHVAGLLLLGDIISGGTVSGDPDGHPDIIAHH